MDLDRLRELIESVRNGSMDVETCMDRLKGLPSEDLGWACLDHHRRFRDILPEVIYGPGKSARQLVEIVRSMAARGGPVLVTRVDEEKAQEVIGGFSWSDIPVDLQYSKEAGALFVEDGDYADRSAGRRGYIAVATAGTADIPVAEEACLTLRLAGHEVRRIYDAGVAGVHRLFSRMDILSEATAIIVVAGMDGALPSVIGGLVAVPVIAVPASTGYGANLGGIAPLLTMLNSCATGVCVVNIDNGFGAAAVAAMINMQRG